MRTVKPVTLYQRCARATILGPWTGGLNQQKLVGSDFKGRLCENNRRPGYTQSCDSK